MHKKSDAAAKKDVAAITLVSTALNHVLVFESPPSTDKKR